MQRCKKALAVAVLLLGLALCLSACGKSAPNTDQIKQNIPGEARVIYVNDEEVMLDVTEVNILKRQTNEKDDTVYCTIVMENDDYQYSDNWMLTYNYYDQGGWILDSWSTEGDSAEIIPLHGISAEIADAEMNNYYFHSYELTSQSFGDDSSAGDYTSYFDYAVEFDGTNFSYHGTVSLDYYFYVDGNCGTWKTLGISYEDPWEWNVEGSWECTSLEERFTSGRVYDVYIDIESFDYDYVILSATKYDRGFGFTFSEVEIDTMDTTTVGVTDDISDYSYDKEKNLYVNYNAPKFVFEFSPNGYLPYFQVTFESDYASMCPMGSSRASGPSVEMVKSTS